MRIVCANAFSNEELDDFKRRTWRHNYFIVNSIEKDWHIFIYVSNYFLLKIQVNLVYHHPTVATLAFKFKLSDFVHSLETSISHDARGVCVYFTERFSSSNCSIPENQPNTKTDDQETEINFSVL